MLPLLLLVMAWAVRQALRPLDALRQELQDRGPEALQPLAERRAPQELQPLLAAMNGLLARIDGMVQRERRFTADAAHELRTPLAVLRAQWEVMRGATDAGARAQAEQRLGAGLDRMDRLVTQMLALARLDAGPGALRSEQLQPIVWRPLVAQVVGEVLPLAERRRAELAVEWPPAGRAPLPLQGDPELLAVLLRNLLDNALRYGPAGGTVSLVLGVDELRVENEIEGEALPAEQLQRLGERFYRPAGQNEIGSGLGVSIARRIADLHGLGLQYRLRDAGGGLVARLARPG